MNDTCLTNPPGSSNAFIVKPTNIGKFAAQMFSRHSKEIAEALDANITEKITKLEKADAQLTSKSGDSAKVARSCAPSCSEIPLVLIAAGSDSDMPHLETLKKEINKFKIDAEIRICSAHKQPGRLENVIEEYNNSERPIIMVGCAGGTDALSGTASYLSKFPVVSCPPDGMNNTCLTNPPGSSNAFIVKPANIAKFAAQVFAQRSEEINKALDASIAEKIVKLEKADAQLTGKTSDSRTNSIPFTPLPADAKPLAVIAAGSDSDMPHLETLKKELAKFKIDSEIRICSAHKQPARLESVIAEYNKSARPIMLVGCAGGTDALSGTASYLANFPVVSCPPEASKNEVNNTCLTNPPGSSNAYILRPANVAKFAAQMFARSNKAVAAALDANIAEKITKLESADEQLAKKRRVEVGEDAGQCGA